MIRWPPDTNRSSNLLWLYGCVGVGKSAVAQSIAESCRDRGWLGATFFFSPLITRDELDRVILTLVYQLAIAFPSYKELASRIIVNDPTILNHSLPAQFHSLITELLLNDKRWVTEPLVFFLDGLDECDEEELRQELVRLIAAFATTAHSLGLSITWIILSRFDWRVAASLSKFDVWKEELQIDTPEARNDISIFLLDGFAKVRNKYPDAFAEETPWPGEGNLLAIELASSGYFAIASSILQFLDGDILPNPAVRLKLAVDFLKSDGVLPGRENPLESVYSLYRGVLKRVHADVISTALKILLLPSLIRRDLPAQLVANVLFLDQATFYGSLRQLRSILSVPLPRDAARDPVKPYHASFRVFLEQELFTRSLESYLGISVVQTVVDIHMCFIQWCDAWGRSDGTSLSSIP